MNDINTIIDDSFLNSLYPCKDRYDLYKKHYFGQKFSVEEFIELKEISWDDKFYVMWNGKFLTIKQNIELGLAFAESVLHIYEADRPEDKRPRAALEAALDGKISLDVVGDAYPSYYESYSDAAADSARAVYYASFAVFRLDYESEYCIFATASSAAYYAAHASSKYYNFSVTSGPEFQVIEILKKIKDKKL